VALAAIARAHGLDVLCEAHDEPELQRALDAGCDLIGINSRNLRTFEVESRNRIPLAEKIPADMRSRSRKRHPYRPRSGASASRRLRSVPDRRIADEAEHPGEALEVDGRSKASRQ
jgi:indole-3-glycerol phosphate synthase